MPDLIARTVTGLRKTVDLSAFTALSPDGDGTAADRALFERMTNEPLAPGPNGFFTRQRVLARYTQRDQSTLHLVLRLRGGRGGRGEGGEDGDTYPGCPCEHLEAAEAPYQAFCKRCGYRFVSQ